MKATPFLTRLVILAGTGGVFATAAPSASQGVAHASRSELYDAEHCEDYDSSVLKITEHAGVWTLRAGVSMEATANAMASGAPVSGWLRPLATFSNQHDAANAAVIARYYGVQCFIGRESAARAKDHFSMYAMYWKGSGKAPAISPESCDAYIPSSLRVVKNGADRWMVTDGANVALTFVTKSAASDLLRVARRYSAHCTIGRDPRRERFEYWK